MRERTRRPAELSCRRSPRCRAPRGEAILSLSWEPAFCEGHANKRECASATPSGFDATHFTLHGLWPQPRRKQYCNVS